MDRAPLPAQCNPAFHDFLLCILNLFLVISVVISVVIFFHGIARDGNVDFGSAWRDLLKPRQKRPKTFRFRFRNVRVLAPHDWRRLCRSDLRDCCKRIHRGLLNQCSQ